MLSSMQPVIVIFISLYFCPEFVKSGCNWIFNCTNRKAWLAGKFLFLAVLLFGSLTVSWLAAVSLLCWLGFDLDFSWTLTGKFLYYSSFGLQQSFSGSLAAGPLCSSIWVVLCRCYFLLIGLSRLLDNFYQRSKVPAWSATLNLWVWRASAFNRSIRVGNTLFWLSFWFALLYSLTLERDVR